MIATRIRLFPRRVVDAFFLFLAIAMTSDFYLSLIESWRPTWTTRRTSSAGRGIPAGRSPAPTMLSTPPAIVMAFADTPTAASARATGPMPARAPSANRSGTTPWLIGASPPDSSLSDNHDPEGRRSVGDQTSNEPPRRPSPSGRFRHASIDGRATQ